MLKQPGKRVKSENAPKHNYRVNCTQSRPTSAKAPEAYYRVGVIYMSQNDMDDAKAYLVRVVESYPDSESAAAAQDRLDEIG